MDYDIDSQRAWEQFERELTEKEVEIDKLMERMRKSPPVEEVRELSPRARQMVFRMGPGKCIWHYGLNQKRRRRPMSRMERRGMRG
jgi:hypothetical protein